MEMPTMNNGSVGEKFTEHSVVNELGQCRFSPLDTRVKTIQSVKIVVSELAVLSAL